MIDLTVKKVGKRFVILGLLSVLVMSSAYSSDEWNLVLSLKGLWKFSIGDNKSWASPKYSDTGWETIKVPSKWEDEGFYGYDGYAWYRKTFDGQILKNRNLGYTLFLGYIDDVDEVYLNGHKIGYSGAFPPRYYTAYNAFRQYSIPSEYINFGGQNLIAVRVFDAEIEGGIVSGDVGIYVNKNDMGLQVNLRGLWDFKLIGNSYPDQAPAEGGEWAHLMVPGIWEHQGFKNYDGNAWYRKRVFIPKDLEGEDLVLMLGKIDDFDDTYFNGEKVGTTRISADYRRETAYGKLRVYYIRAGLVKAGEWNTIAVFVEDIGGEGGIYEGPVGIVRQSEFTRFMRWR